MTSVTKSFLFFAAFLLIAAVFLLPGVLRASTPPGIAATIATSSNPVVGTTAVVVFATSSCAARIVTTVASPVMITFSDDKTPTALFGHLQPASTTVAYDASQYGCGQTKMYGFVSSAITVSESR